jgi:hypothetical protein
MQNKTNLGSVWNMLSEFRLLAWIIAILLSIPSGL